jgi:4-diphosphocytidyl-2-C-methyl-D-erythritol kinase
MAEPVFVPAYAKINLCLEVLGRRPDGMHEIRTVLQTVSLHDRLRFQPASEVHLHARGPLSSPDNLILRAAHLLRSAAGVRAGVDIRWEKRIPVGAGLGGGSADAAATLRALDELWGTHLGGDALQALAGQLGADVPFFIRGGTALATGTGRDLTPLPPPPDHWLVLAAIEAAYDRKTGEMYASLSSEDFGDGGPVDRMAQALGRGVVPYSAVVSSFERPAVKRWPVTRDALALLKQHAPLAATVTGAGPSVFGLFDSRSRAIRALRELRTLGLRAHLLRFISTSTGSDRGTG